MSILPGRSPVQPEEPLDRRGETVQIRQSVLDEIAAHARAEAPNECCGLLLGASGIIEQAARARNLRASRTRYLIDPQDHFAALRAARGSGRAVIGAYHSHPSSPATPSETDRAEATYPEYLYLIVSPDRDDRATDVRGYRWDEGNFREVMLVTIP